MPKIVWTFLRLPFERPHTLFGLTWGQNNVSYVTVSDLGENVLTIFNFHEDFRMPKIVWTFIRLPFERPHTRFGRTWGQKNESFVTVSDIGENALTLFNFHEDFRMPKIVWTFIRLPFERPHTRFWLSWCQKNESFVTVSDLGENAHTLFIFH